MSAKFAPMTADLLARKGEAMPSPLASNPFSFHRSVERPQAPAATPPGEGAQPKSPLVHDIRKTPALAPEVHAPARPRRITVTLTAREHEALGILAVKRDVTRHRIIR